ncbi:hypothetical protein BJX76DRAFT_32267 [Aspergillus varians]
MALNAPLGPFSRIPVHIRAWAVLLLYSAFTYILQDTRKASSEMCDAFYNKRPSNGPGFGYPPPQPGYSYPPGPPPPGPGYGHSPPPPAYDSHNNYNNYNTNYGHPYGAPPQPAPNNYSYPGEKASYYNNNNNYYHPPPRNNNGPGYGPPPGPILNTFHPNINTGPNPPPPVPPSTTPRALLLRQSPETHKIILIHPADTPITAPPLYTLTSSPKASKADYVLARGANPNDPSTLIASVKSHTFSSKYDLVVRGTPCLLRESGGGCNYNLEIPGVGKYKWVTDAEKLGVGSKMWLKDEAKTRVLATYDKSRGASSVGGWKKFVGGKDRELVLNAPCEEFFVEVLLVSLYAVKMAKEGAVEAAGEIVGALAGA